MRPAAIKGALLLASACLLALALAAPAGAVSFGLKDLDLSATDAEGGTYMQAGSHPFAITVASAVNTEEDEETGAPIPVEAAKDVQVTLPPGAIGKRDAVQACPMVDFLAGETSGGDCPLASVVGVARIEYGNSEGPQFESQPVYSLLPAPGTAAKLGLLIEGGIVPVVVQATLSPTPPYNVIATASNISQEAYYLSSQISLWGVPSDPRHDSERGSCLRTPEADECKAPPGPAFLTLPTRCEGPLATSFEADSWQNPGFPSFARTVFTHGPSGEPLGTGGCEKLAFHPQVSSRPTTASAQSPSGQDFSIEVEDPGILSPNEDAVAASQIRKIVVQMPPGMSANPSLAEGLGVCSQADLARESASSAPGEGCPGSSKIGTVSVTTPLVGGRVLGGQVYVATPYENLAHNSLIALYVVIKDAELGAIVRQPVAIEPDPASGRLRAVVEEVPQIPFSELTLHLREGGRSPLITPPACGTHETLTTLYPWSGGAPSTEGSPFELTSGPGGGPCPPATAPFDPDFEAGTESNAAGAYSPFSMRLTRADAEQDIGRFSAKLPPGVVGSIAGVSQCPEAAIALARSRTGPHGGYEERQHPACPQGSQVGTTVAGAGVGSELTYVRGSLYLAGPFGGDPLSVVAVTPAVAGPFDAGTVVVREALTLNPVSGEVRSRQRPLRTDPPHPQGHPAEPPRPARRRRPPALHPERHQLRRRADQGRHLRRRHRPGAHGGERGDPHRPLPGGGLRTPGLQAKARPAAQGRHQARALPRPSRRLFPPQRRRQPEAPGTRLPAL